MGINRGIPAKRVEYLRLTESIRQVVIAPDCMGDAHIMVIDNDREHIGRSTVRPQHDQVVELGIANRNGPLNSVFDDCFAGLRCLEADNGINAGGSICRIAVAPCAVIAHGALFGLGFFAHLGKFVR